GQVRAKRAGRAAWDGCAATGACSFPVTCGDRRAGARQSAVRGAEKLATRDLERQVFKCDIEAAGPSNCRANRHQKAEAGSARTLLFLYGGVAQLVRAAES